MSSEQQVFAKRALEAFAAAGHTTDQEVAAAGGPSSTTMTTLRKIADGKLRVARLRSDTLKGIDAAAGWTPGTAKASWLNGTDIPFDSHTGSLAGGGALMRAAFDPRVMEGYLRQLESRILDTEDRLDALEARVEGGTSDVASAAQKSGNEGDGEGGGGSVTELNPKNPSQGPPTVDLSREPSAAAPKRRDKGQGDDDA